MVELGYPVFLVDGADAFGAVRGVTRQHLWVNIENAGDFRIPFGAVEKVASKKVVVRWELLPPEVQEAIRHTLDVEDFPEYLPDDEAERVSDEEDEAHVLGRTQAGSPLDEFPGRDVGSRYGAPPSATVPRRR